MDNQLHFYPSCILQIHVLGESSMSIRSAVDFYHIFIQRFLYTPLHSLWICVGWYYFIQARRRASVQYIGLCEWNRNEFEQNIRNWRQLECVGKCFFFFFSILIRFLHLSQTLTTSSFLYVSCCSGLLQYHSIVSFTPNPVYRQHLKSNNMLGMTVSKELG